MIIFNNQEDYLLLIPLIVFTVFIIFFAYCLFCQFILTIICPKFACILGFHKEFLFKQSIENYWAIDNEDFGKVVKYKRKIYKCKNCVSFSRIEESKTNDN